MILTISFWTSRFEGSTQRYILSQAAKLELAKVWKNLMFTILALCKFSTVVNNFYDWKSNFRAAPLDFYLNQKNVIFRFFLRFWIFRCLKTKNVQTFLMTFLFSYKQPTIYECLNPPTYFRLITYLEKRTWTRNVDPKWYYRRSFEVPRQWTKYNRLLRQIFLSLWKDRGSIDRLNWERRRQWPKIARTTIDRSWIEFGHSIETTYEFRPQ